MELHGKLEGLPDGVGTRSDVPTARAAVRASVVRGRSRQKDYVAMVPRGTLLRLTGPALWLTDVPRETSRSGESLLRQDAAD